MLVPLSAALQNTSQFLSHHSEYLSVVLFLLSISFDKIQVKI